MGGVAPDRDMTIGLMHSETLLFRNGLKLSVGLRLRLPSLAHVGISFGPRV